MSGNLKIGGQPIMFKRLDGLSSLEALSGWTADILERITDPVLVLNLEGRCLHINPAAMALFCHAGAGSSGLPLWPLPATLWEACDAAAKTGRPTTREWRMPNCLRWVECRAYPSETGFTLLLQDITARKQAEQSQRGLADRLDLIARVARAVVASAPLNEQMRVAAEQVRDAFGVDACVIRGLEGDQLVLLGSAGLPEGTLFPTLPARFGIANQIITERHPIGVPDVHRYPMTASIQRAGYEFTAYAGAPLLVDNQVVGLLGIYVTHEPREFTEADLEHLQIVAHYAAVSLVNDRLYKSLEARIQERERAEAALRASETRFQALFENSLDAIGVLCHGSHVYGNPAYRRLFGIEGAATLADIPVRRLLAPNAKNRILRQIREEARRNGGEAENRTGALVLESTGQRHDNGKTFPIEVHGSTYTHDGRMYTVLIVRDITERKHLEAEREQMLVDALSRAERDPLTHLLNHHSFHQRLHEEAKHAVCEQESFALVLMDMNNFKFFNEAYGHASGDRVLQKVAEALRAFCGPNDLAARLGGDEFALLLPGVSDATALSRRLQKSVLRIGYRPPDHAVQIPIGLSAGIVLFPRETANLAEAITLADERMRRGKYSGTDAFAETSRELLTQSMEGFSMLDALVAAVDNKDRYTRRHSEEVMRYALWIAQEMSLSADDKATLKAAALLHDVGKIGVPDRILRQPGRLSDADYAAMKQHPALGALMVAAVPGLEHLVPAVRHHHEAWDGSGYPDGLAGAGIPLFARILAVADTFSAMTSDRPYRKALSLESARIVLASGAGLQWDKDCVGAFLRAVAHADRSDEDGDG